MFNFLGNSQIALQNIYIIVYFHEQCMRVLIELLNICNCLFYFTHTSESKMVFPNGFTVNFPGNKECWAPLHCFFLGIYSNSLPIFDYYIFLLLISMSSLDISLIGVLCWICVLWLYFCPKSVSVACFSIS